MADLVATSKDITILITKITGERAKLSSSQQKKDLAMNKRSEHQKPPYHFLVTSVTTTAYNVIINNPIISTAKATAFFLPYSLLVSKFLCTIKGFILSVKDMPMIRELEEEATCIIRDTLLSENPFIDLLKSKLTNNLTLQHDVELATSIISSIEILFSKPEILETSPIKKIMRKTLWNVYCWRPLLVTWPSYFLLL